MQKYKKLANQFIQYCGIGGLAFAVDYGALIFFTERIGVHYLVSTALAFSLGLIVNYNLCTSIIFKQRYIINKKIEFFTFAAIGAIGMLISILIIGFLTEAIGIHYTSAKIITAILILFFNFTLRRHFLFKKSNISKLINQF